MTTEMITPASSDASSTVPVQIVDCDIHVNPRNGGELASFMPARWEQYRDVLYGTGVLGTSVIFAPPNQGRRLDAFGNDGAPAGSDPQLTGRQLFDEAGVDIAIIVPLTEKSTANPEHEAAMAATTNAWIAETWLGRYNRHGRYKGTIRVSSDPELAVEEIEQWADHEHFVQVMLNPYVGGLFGEKSYWPVYEAAIRHDLAVCTHVTLQRPGPALLTTYGSPNWFLENHGQFPLLYGAHLVSMVTEGVFDRFEQLRFSFTEGGYSWVLPLLWHLDRHVKHLRSELPSLQALPSEYVSRHVSFTRQPVEEPPRPAYLGRMVDWLGPQTLEFATDYPHWDGDYNTRQGFAGISPEVRARILAGNAIEKYRLDPTRSSVAWQDA